MKMPQWEEYRDKIYLQNEMDPLYESALARALSGWPRESELEAVLEEDQNKVNQTAQQEEVFRALLRAMA